jgi:HAD superfamily hydrolase (TIGR01484 family)
MDRTLLPNGDAAAAPAALPTLARLVDRADIRLAYVTGRDRQLVEDAMQAYDLPVPDYVIGDVGTTIYTVTGDDWQLWAGWHEEIGHSWHGLSHDDLQRALDGISQLRLQEAAKQNRYKLSYYAPAMEDASELLADVRRCLADLDIDCSVIWSVDETQQQGLLDILPASASKYHAVDYLMRHCGCDFGNTLFAGDSGNDLDVLCSPIPAVLVANATTVVRDEALQLAAQRGGLDRLYLAHGGFLGMNGNYAAGILEGVSYYFPQLISRLTDDNK